MAKNTSNGIREFVKNSLNSYYKNFLTKLSDNPQPNDINPTIKMVNDGSVYVYDIGGYEGLSTQNTSTLLKVINNAESNIDNINSSLYDLSINSIKTIKAGNNINVEKRNNTATISALGYAFNKAKSSFAENGGGAIASGNYSHAEGRQTNASGAYGSHAEGCLTIASGMTSHAEGYRTQATKLYAHAEGCLTIASGTASHAEGMVTKAVGLCSHAEGDGTTASKWCSHAEGYGSEASGEYSHAEGYYTTASYPGAHTEGIYTKALDLAAHAEGVGTIANNKAEHAEGKYNVSHLNTIHSIGIGSSSQSKNAIEVLNDGSIFITGLATTNSYDGTSITNVSTLQEVINEKLDKSAAAAGLRYEVVTVLPQPGETNIVYLVSSTTTTSGNVYDEKMWINGKYETIGTTLTDLANYYTKLETSTYFIEKTHLYINGTYSTNSTTSIYAPTSAGTSGQYLKSNGTNSAPTWVTLSLNDEKVKQEAASTASNAYYPIISVTSSTTSGTVTTSVLYLTGIKVNPQHMSMIIGTSASGYILAQNTGAIASGACPGTNSYISVGGTGVGAFAHGFIGSANSSINANASGAHAHGYIDGTGSYNSISADGEGSVAHGYVGGLGSSNSIKASASGAIAGGYAQYSGTIISSSDGAFAHGYLRSGGSIIASNIGAHAEGAIWSGGTISATGRGSHAEGYVEAGATIDASGAGSHAEGACTHAYGHYSHAEGFLTTASGLASHAEGYKTQATKNYAHAEGLDTSALGNASHTEGYRTTVNASCGHAEGYYTTVSGQYSHAEGYFTTASKLASHAEGWATSASGIASHAEGYVDNGIIDASGTGAHAEGYAENNSSIYASGNGAHAGGYAWSNGHINALGPGSFAHGYAYNGTIDASGDGAHAEGISTKATNNGAHAEGSQTTASGTASHAEGYYTTASGNYSHAGGYYTLANVANVTAIGRCNTTCSTGDLFVVGNGSTSSLRKTVFKIADANGTTAGGNSVVVTVDGHIDATAFYQSSDERLKNIKSELSVEDCYKLINDCSTIIYSLKTDETDQNQIGMIAQLVKEIMPEVVQESNGYYSINYSRLSVVALNLIKSLSERIIELEKDHNKLEELIKRVEKLEK